jgi:type IV pilus biogenesis protein PilP
MLNSKKIRGAIVAALLLPATCISAEQVVSDQQLEQQSQASKQSKKTPANEIADINENIAVLTARLAQLEVRSKIAQKEAEILKANNPAAGMPGMDDFIPTVAYIDGVDGKLKASLYVQGGNLQSVKVGDTVSSWKVKDIKMDSVTVQKGKDVIRLGFGSYSSSKENAVNAQSNPSIQR